MDTTIIIPSTCESRRAATLDRALESLLGQRMAPRVLVIANGSRVDAAVVERLSRRTGVAVLRQDEGSLPAAIRFGRSRVDTPFFGFLDDDDEYLPDALHLRRTVMDSDGSIDAVVTNGYTHRDGRDRMRHEHPGRAAGDPLRALIHENWLASCGGLFRTATVPVAYFDGVTRNYEWTVFGYKLAATRKVRYIDTPTFRVYDSPGSLSKSREFRTDEPAVLEAILASLELPGDVRVALRRKIGRAHHSLSAMYLAEGARQDALKHHLKSLAAPGGLAYVLYARKLLPFWPRNREPVRR